LERVDNPIPTPIPTAGTPCGVVPSCVHNGFVVVWLPRSIPDFGRFYGSHGAVVVVAPAYPVGSRPTALAKSVTSFGFIADAPKTDVPTVCCIVKGRDAI